MAAPGVYELGRLIGPTVAAMSATQWRDVQSLVESLLEPTGGDQANAEHALRHMVRALLAADDLPRPLFGENSGPWAELVARTMAIPTPEIVNSLRPLLQILHQPSEQLTTEQNALHGEAARQLLMYAWRQGRRDSWLVETGLKAVCETYMSAPE